MDPADGFLDAICAAPDDDTPRLVFADWLDEHGEAERAEFIRVQCRIAREPPACVTGRSLPLYGDFTARCRCPGCSLRRREYMASRRHIVWDWLGGAGCPFVSWAGADDWRRGFVYRINAPCAALLRHAGTLFASQPVEHVTLAGTSPLTWSHPHPLAAWVCDQGGARELYGLPPALWDLLAAPPDISGRPLKHYANAAEAEADLSRAAVAFGRAEARKLRHARQDAR